MQIYSKAFKCAKIFLEKKLFLLKSRKFQKFSLKPKKFQKKTGKRQCFRSLWRRSHFITLVVYFRGSKLLASSCSIFQGFADLYWFKWYFCSLHAGLAALSLILKQPSKKEIHLHLASGRLLSVMNVIAVICEGILSLGGHQHGLISDTLNVTEVRPRAELFWILPPPFTLHAVSIT